MCSSIISYTYCDNHYLNFKSDYMYVIVISQLLLEYDIYFIVTQVQAEDECY